MEVCKIVGGQRRYFMALKGIQKKNCNSQQAAQREDIIEQCLNDGEVSGECNSSSLLFSPKCVSKSSGKGSSRGIGSLEWARAVMGIGEPMNVYLGTGDSREEVVANITQIINEKEARKGRQVFVGPRSGVEDEGYGFSEIFEEYLRDEDPDVDEEDGLKGWD